MWLSAFLLGSFLLPSTDTADTPGAGLPPVPELSEDVLGCWVEADAEGDRNAENFAGEKCVSVLAVDWKCNSFDDT